LQQQTFAKVVLLCKTVDDVNSPWTCDRDNSFDAKSFLSLFRGKHLTLFGDSLTRQLSISLISSLKQYETSSTSLRFYFSGYYAKFEARVTFFDNGPGLFLVNHSRRPSQQEQIIQSEVFINEILPQTDYLIVGIAAWHAPGVILPLNDSLSYDDNIRNALSFYNQTLFSLRDRVISEFNRRTKKPQNSLKIIWRLSPHAGSPFEMDHLYPMPSPDLFAAVQQWDAVQNTSSMVYHSILEFHYQRLSHYFSDRRNLNELWAPNSYFWLMQREN